VQSQSLDQRSLICSLNRVYCWPNPTYIPNSLSCPSNLRTPSVTHSKPSTSNELWDPRLVDKLAPKAVLRCYNLQKNGTLSIRKPRLLSCSLDATRNLGRLLVLGSSSRPTRHRRRPFASRPEPQILNI
jgi:hypothetical protein